ncbi:GTP-binding protein lepA [Salpingoeca rosetta]|uniref:Translation factor GUF1 homolog, mitochondrial n=1 Tax=Salpingoeca rosetta (strain ATCC 50818 / BSB-021) TaxID=946362 RepID=F2UL06_SALR5|nr:GTP-binding protein lepA [Salpingoeca rosetta]EGD77805.1 GTP-binding protein lepA [Salpingoeca rosetta]|eukprot:XP_004990281.1 GTP-binding protein lepA [Salpingoeca rosetta]
MRAARRCLSAAKLTVIPVVNKVDLPSANVQGTIDQMASTFDVDPEDVICVSGKTGMNVPAILDAVVQRVPAPAASRTNTFHALLFDSWYDDYRGVIALMEVMDGTLQPGDKIVSANSPTSSYDVLEVGIMHPAQRPTTALHAGQVGYVVCGMRQRAEARVGDTFYHKGAAVEALPGFKPAKPMVFAGLFPIEQMDYEPLSSALERLTLNDPAVTIHRDVSPALGPGWRLGFLGFLHMEVFSQRLEQEYGTQTLLTSPSVSFRKVLKDGTAIDMQTPSHFPTQDELHTISHFEEPMVLGTLVFPQEYTGALISLCESRRGEQRSMRYMEGDRVILQYKLPLAEVIENFYDQVKACSSGYATFDYEELGYEAADLVKLQLLLNGEPVDALSAIVHSSRGFPRGKALCKRLKETIPRQLFDIAIQASMKGRVVARETVKALRKDVTAKCYGGDITRKRKLLQKQKEGKKKMRQIGNVQLPKEAFLSVLSPSPKK